jgi:flavin-dependent dehydrogenase
MRSAFDLAVLGGGPAGAACALEAARRGLATVLLDPLEPGTDRPCGEGIMPGGIDALRELGLEALVHRGRPFAGLRHVVWSAPPLDIDLPRPGMALRRTELTAAFDGALRASPLVTRVGAAGTALPDDGGFTVEADGAGRFRARVLVLADGSGGRAAPWLRAERSARRPTPRFGLRARFTERALLERVTIHVGWGCAVYLTPLPDRLVNVAVLFEHAPEEVGGPDALLAWALARHPAAGEHLGTLVTPPVGRALGHVRPRTPAAAGVFLAGDAGGAVDPIVGCGVAIALKSGVLAARGAAAIVAGDDPRAVLRRYVAAYRRESRARHVLASLLRWGEARPRIARAVVSLLGRMPRAADGLARIAGGR